MSTLSNIGDIVRRSSEPAAIVLGTATGLMFGSGNYDLGKYTGLAMVATISVYLANEMFSGKKQGNIPDSIRPLGFSVGGLVAALCAEQHYHLVDRISSLF